MNSPQPKRVIAVVARVCFPEGFMVGHGERKSNALGLERNGLGVPVLRGSSLAGVLREQVRQHETYKDYEEDYLGKPLTSEEERQESDVVFLDMQVDCGTEDSMHNRICRHTGSVSEENKGLFSLERVGAGAEATCVFYLKRDKYQGTSEEQDNAFMRFLAESLHGVQVGGSGNRGLGRCLLKDNAYGIQVFDLETADGAAAFLDWQYSQDRRLPAPRTLKVAEAPRARRFAVEVQLRIPLGQDLLVAEGNDMYPLSTQKADGQSYWKIPGSTFRGIFRGWMSRLAARDGEKLIDSVQRYQTRGDRKDVDDTEGSDVIRDLFGSLENKGRIHFTDAYSNRPCNPQADTQKRRHVVIDRFTGGTNDGKLFENSVLVDTRGDLRFTLTVSIDDARDCEIRWLEQSFRALELGLLRIGSSKAAGRLEICAAKVLCKPDETTAFAVK